MKSTKYQLLKDDFDRACKELKIRREMIEELREEVKKWKFAERVSVNVLKKNTQELIKAQKEIVRLTKIEDQFYSLMGWCCMECEENFYIPLDSVDINELVVYCPYCGEFQNTVVNTINKTKS